MHLVRQPGLPSRGRANVCLRSRIGKPEVEATPAATGGKRGLQRRVAGDRLCRRAESWQAKCNVTTVKPHGGCPMKTKMTCIAILLAFGFLTNAASADQSYRFTLNVASRIGNAELQPGEYKLVVDGPKVVLTELRTHKSIALEANVENADKKFDRTEIHTEKVDGVSQISEIRIGGSRTKVAFH
jgi:hypothetical protein